MSIYTSYRIRAIAADENMYIVELYTWVGDYTPSLESSWQNEV